MVEVTGVEPAASASRTQRSTKLSHTSQNKLQSNYTAKMQSGQGDFYFGKHPIVGLNKRKNATSSEKSKNLARSNLLKA